MKWAMLAAVALSVGAPGLTYASQPPIADAPYLPGYDAAATTGAASGLPPGGIDEVVKEQQNLERHFVAASCRAPMGQYEITYGIPGALRLGAHDAAVSRFLVLGPSQHIPSKGSRLNLRCNLIVEWNNGVLQMGVFKEWISRYGQHMVWWGDVEPLSPSAPILSHWRGTWRRYGVPGKPVAP